MCFGLLFCHIIKILLIILDEFLCKLSEYVFGDFFIHFATAVMINESDGAQAMTAPPPCFINELVCLGS